MSDSEWADKALDAFLAVEAVLSLCDEFDEDPKYAPVGALIRQVIKDATETTEG